MISQVRVGVGVGVGVYRRRYSSRFNYNPDPFSEQEPSEVLEAIRHASPGTGTGELRLSDHTQLARFHRPARPSLSLARDFIHDSLYNPNYGYFFNHLQIIHHQPHDLTLVPQSQSQSPPTDPLPNFHQRQIWHTPSELFKPWYAWSIASLMVKKHLEEGSKTLKIYEIGAGNGTLCCGILDYIHQNHPELYPHTSYVTIELSTRLADRQRQKISDSGHSSRASVVNQSILSLSHNPQHPPSSLFTPTEEPCWILGMEVLDNLSRDVIRRDPISRQPFQSIVITDLHGDFHERFIPITPSNNPNLSTYLRLFNSDSKPGAQNRWKKFVERFRLKYLPFQSNLTPYEFVPTNHLTLFRNLFEFFPNHKLILSDFSHLTNSMSHLNQSVFSSLWAWLSRNQNHGGAPVVQTRYNGMTIPVSTFLVKPGLFDIFFPTDFDELVRVYRAVCDQQNPDEAAKKEKEIKLMDHHKFLLEYLKSPGFKKSLDRYNAALVKDHGGDADPGSLKGPLTVDPEQVFGYYQNTKVLTIT